MQNWLVLEFSTGGQAEKAKAILEKMEFGPMPGDDERLVTEPGGSEYYWRSLTDWARFSAWRMGALRRKA